jgi:molybdopterin synthase catalytic subunit
MTLSVQDVSPGGHPGALEDVWCLVDERLPDAGVASRWAVRSSTGAVVSFAGTVRDYAPGHHDVTGITYQAYDSEALRRLDEIARRAKQCWDDVDRVALWHRTGHVALGEESVLAVVSAAHRPAAFDAARFCVDVLKMSVPVWKLEHDSAGTGWSETGHDALSVAEASERWMRDQFGTSP